MATIRREMNPEDVGRTVDPIVQGFPCTVHAAVRSVAGGCSTAGGSKAMLSP